MAFTSQAASTAASGSTARKRKAPATATAPSETASQGSPAPSSAANKRRAAQTAAAGKRKAAAAAQETPAGSPENVSGDPEDNDDKDEEDGGEQQDGAGTSNQPKGRSTRKAQNRNAQRESRQRKQDYVKSLEAMVALHRVDMSSQLHGTLLAIGWLVEENLKLRDLLGRMSAFFGDLSLGSRTHELGVSMADLKDVVERNDKSHLIELGDKLRERMGLMSREEGAEQALQGLNDSPKAPTGPDLHDDAHQNIAQSDPIFGHLTSRAEMEMAKSLQQARAAAQKTSKSESDSASPATTKVVQDRDSSSSAAPHKPIYLDVPQSPAKDALSNSSANTTPLNFNDYLDASYLNSQLDGNFDLGQLGFGRPGTGTFPMPDFGTFGFTMPSFTSPAPTHPPYPSLSHAAYPQSRQSVGPDHLPSGNDPAEHSMQHFAQPTAHAHNTLVSGMASGGVQSTSLATATCLQAMKDTSRTLHKQAKQLIHYHLRAKAEDPMHELPPALQSTPAQSIMPHDTAIDAILWPSVRDRLILAGPSLDVPSVLKTLNSDDSLIVHATGDLLDPSAWEMSAEFVEAYPTLLDGELIKTCNRWRLARNEQPITL